MSRNFELLQQMEREKEHKVLVPLLAPPVVSPKRVPTGFDENAFAKEERAKLVQRIFWPSTERETRSVVFCGVDEARGSHSLCMDVARELASRTSDSVCVLPAKEPIQEARTGLNADLSSPFSSEDLMRYAHQIESNLWVMPDGHLCTSEGLPTLPIIRQQLEQLRNAFTYVLVDARPVGLNTDTALLSQMADGVVLVLEANVTRKTAARMAKETLESAGASLLGVVLNNRTFPIPDALYRRL